jgi:hypothetical protein
MPISLSTVVRTNVPDGLKFQQSKLHAGLFKGVYAAGIGIQSDVVSNRIHGPKPEFVQQRTGNLARNIVANEPVDSGSQITGEVGIGSTAWYGKLLEGGGTFVGIRRLKLPPHMVTRARGERVMTGSPYGIHFREYRFLRDSLEENTRNGRIRAWIENAMRAELG